VTYQYLLHTCICFENRSAEAASEYRTTNLLSSSEDNTFEADE